MIKITLWHREGSMPAFTKTEALFDGESPAPDEIKKEDGLEPGYFLTVDDMQKLWDAVSKTNGNHYRYATLHDYLASLGLEGEEG